MDTTTGEAQVAEVPKRNVLAILIMVFGNTFAALLPGLVAMPIIIARIDPANKAASLGTAVGVMAFLGMLLAPVFGVISDRTTSRFGMRRPGLLIGTATTTVGLAVLGVADSLALVYLAGVILAVGTSMSGASNAALIPDCVPGHARGRVFGFATLLGVVAGLMASVIGPRLIDHQFAMAAGGVPVLVLTTAVGLVLYRDRVLDPRDVPRQPVLRTLLDGYRFDPRSAPDYGWVWLGRLLLTFGISFGGAFAIYFLTDQLHVGRAELPSVISLTSALGMAGTTVGTLVGLFAADKVRSRKSMVLASGVLMAVGGVVAAFSASVPVFTAGSTLIYFAVGVFIPADGVLCMAVLPDDGRNVSKYMSIFTIADQFPRSIGPMVAPVVISLGAATPLGGYPLLYLAAGIFAIIGGLLVRRVRGVL
ncbi:MFS transporter [Streptomyces sp. NPDC013978]|uniref:MFS transporter n=1 Tax=Streptomyces sp. NPDC013978 TaxID=3364869 RepID=UPI0036FC06AC